MGTTTSFYFRFRISHTEEMGTELPAYFLGIVAAVSPGNEEADPYPADEDPVAPDDGE